MKAPLARVVSARAHQELLRSHKAAHCFHQQQHRDTMDHLCTPGSGHRVYSTGYRVVWIGDTAASELEARARPRAAARTSAAAALVTYV